MMLLPVELEAFACQVEGAKREGFTFCGAKPPGNPWARAYAHDVPMLLEHIQEQARLIDMANREMARISAQIGEVLAR